MGKYASRKFILAILGLVVPSILVWFTKISADVYENVLRFTVGAYMLGNVAHEWTVQSGGQLIVSRGKQDSKPEGQ